MSSTPPSADPAVKLELRGLSKRYPGGAEALRDVDMRLAPGDVLGLIGPSGAGKSTLIRCINRLVEPSQGSVRLDGEELTSLGAGALRRARRRIGMIFQEFALVERLTVMENVLSGRLGYTGLWRSLARRFPPEDVEAALSLLSRVGLEGFTDQRADRLSGGQRQRVGIARALIQQPELLLVDEPTASLDPKTARQIMRLICELAAERSLTAVVNIHDVPLATRFLPRIVGLRDGRVVFDGPASELTAEALTAIYGEEDWRDTAADGDEDRHSGAPHTDREA
ncbi:phosphonate ABC transporter ATP-binding protein [Acidobacteria bacterium Mor1]|nr:phosphonate ABC transporter ATP-binding protein [Acidobacteria bacterium Mor1]